MPYNTKILTVALAVALAVTTTAQPWTNEPMGEDCNMSPTVMFGTQNSQCCAAIQVALTPVLAAFGAADAFNIDTTCPLGDFTEFNCAETEEDCAGWALFNSADTPELVAEEMCMDNQSPGWYSNYSDWALAYEIACCTSADGVPCDESLVKGMTGAAATYLDLDEDGDGRMDACGGAVYAKCGCSEGTRGYDEGWGGPDCAPAAFLEVEGKCVGPCGGLGTKTSTDGVCMCGATECADPEWCSEPGEYEPVECNTETCAPTETPTTAPTDAPTEAPTMAPTAGPDLSGSSSIAAISASLFGVAAAVVAVM